MLTTFIIICVVFCLIAMAARRCRSGSAAARAADAEDRHETILGILRQQAADLEKEREAGRIDLDEYEESRLELERRVLEETARATDAEVKDQSKVARIISPSCSPSWPAASCRLRLSCAAEPPQRHGPRLPRGRPEPAAPDAGPQPVRQRCGRHRALRFRNRLDGDARRRPDLALCSRARLSSVGRFAEVRLDAFREVDRLVPNNADIIADMADMTATPRTTR
ncbi:MAG: c-type cytochrome biogenesis protein CcmI [Sutterella wadsworthensis]